MGTDPVVSRLMRGALRIAGILCAVAAPACASATTWRVSKNPAGLCTPASPSCVSIQSAVGAAAPGDAIAVDPGAYVENVVIDRSLTLMGSGRDRTTLDGGSAGSVVVVQADVTATLTDLTLADGKVSLSSTGSNEGGGAVLNRGTLALERVDVTHDLAVGLVGGGIANLGSLSVRDCRFLGNASNPVPGGGGGGGALWNGGMADIRDATFTGNQASEGGAIDNEDDLTVTAATLSSNTASARGGGIASSATLVMTGCTFDSNVARGSGGGLFNDDNTGHTSTATVSGCTFHGNTVDPGGGELPGGAISNAGTLSLTNTVLAGDGLSANCRGPIGSRGHNLSSDRSCGLGQAGDLSGTDPRLGPLQDNGGLTLTLALLPGSPALDAGDDAAAPATDQRGFPRIVGRAADIGAYEWLPPGDLNLNGVVDATDLQALVDVLTGVRDPTPAELLAGDVRPRPGTAGRAYGDGQIRADDLNWILRRFLGLEDAP